MIEHDGTVVAVAETHLLETHAAFDALHLDRALLVGDVGLDIEDVHETSKAGNPLLVYPREVHQALDRVDEDTDVQERGEKVGDIEAPSGDRRGAEEDDGDRHHVGRDDHSRAEVRRTFIVRPSTIDEELVA